MKPHLEKQRSGEWVSCPRETAELLKKKTKKPNSQTVKQSAAPKSRQPFKTATLAGALGSGEAPQHPPAAGAGPRQPRPPPPPP